MTNKDLIQAMGNIDPRFIEDAAPDTDQNKRDDKAPLQAEKGISLSTSSTRKFPWRTIIASAVCVAAVISGVFIVNKFIPANPLYTIDPADVEYYYVLTDHFVCSSTEELVSSADAVLIGKVTDIGFKAVDRKTGLSPTLLTESNDVEICTVYSVEVITPYKGVDSEVIKIRVSGGFEDVYMDEQLSALGIYASNGIGIYENNPEIKIGENYLFSLSKRKSGDFGLMNEEQGVMSVREPFKKDIFNTFSAKDIISYFGEDKWQEFKAEYSVIDGSDIEYTIIQADWPIYKDIEELTNAGNIIVLGKVTGISFDILDMQTGKPPTEYSNPNYCRLYTIYDIDVQISYKGSSADKIKLRVIGGIRKDLYLDEMLHVLNKYGENTIPLLADAPIFNIGETYLFVLYQYEDAIPTIVNVHQTAYPISYPWIEDVYSYASVKKIISYFGEKRWYEFLYKISGEIGLTPEQIKELDELNTDNDPTASYPYMEGVIRGEIDPNAPKLDLVTAKKIIAEHDSFEEILSEFKKIQKYPDFVRGSGITCIVYKVSENGAIGILYEQGEIFYQEHNPDGTLKSDELLFGKVYDASDG